LFVETGGIFSGSIRGVNGTSIFARGAEADRQILVYSMSLSTSVDVAMVLPLPVPARAGEDAIRFIDLSTYPEFFRRLDRAFTPLFVAFSMSASLETRTLAVHEVGTFQASFVPSRADFSRLDQRFRLSDDVWKALPRYDDWGFAVFRFRRSSGVLHVHPMALEFPRRDPEQLFFPLVHLHDGRVDEWADLDHRLYCQDVSADRLNRWPPADHWGWETSTVPWRSSSIWSGPPESLESIGRVIACRCAAPTPMSTCSCDPGGAGGRSHPRARLAQRLTIPAVGGGLA